MTIMVRQLVANKDWLFSVGVSELLSWQTLHHLQPASNKTRLTTA